MGAYNNSLFRHKAEIWNYVPLFFLHEVLGLQGYPWTRPIYRYYFGKCSPDFAGLVLIPHQSWCSTHLLL